MRAVLHDLCASQLLFAAGTGQRTTFRTSTDEEIAAIQRRHGEDGSDELLLALMYREGPLAASAIADRAQCDQASLDATLTRLLESGRIGSYQRDGTTVFRAGALVIPIGAPAGWEAAVFDHYKALVRTILGRLDQERTAHDDRVGGSTYTIDVWDAHPLKDEVYQTLGRMRQALSDLRERVQQVSDTMKPPDLYSRVVIYAGQTVIEEEHEGSG